MGKSAQHVRPSRPPQESPATTLRPFGMHWSAATLLHQPCKDHGFARCRAILVARIEPLPAVLLFAIRDCPDYTRISPCFIRQLVHACTFGKINRRLLAAVQHHHAPFGAGPVEVWGLKIHHSRLPAVQLKVPRRCRTLGSRFCRVAAVKADCANPARCVAQAAGQLWL